MSISARPFLSFPHFPPTNAKRLRPVLDSPNLHDLDAKRVLSSFLPNVGRPPRRPQVAVFCPASLTASSWYTETQTVHGSGADIRIAVGKNMFSWRFWVKRRVFRAFLGKKGVLPVFQSSTPTFCFVVQARNLTITSILYAILYNTDFSESTIQLIDC